MSLGRTAYRHAARSSQTPFSEHVWVSDELLASKFRRFVNGQQRRYESRVPGPLEARRRLAKRRNTALASVAGSGMDDIACLLGRNGREHLKWGETGGGGLDDQIQLPTRPPAPPSANFFTEHVHGLESGNPLRNQSKKLTRDGFHEGLRNYQTASALKDAILESDIDLRQEPSYSQQLFAHLMLLLDLRKTAVKQLALFLDDTHLNVPAARNYEELVNACVSNKGRFRFARRNGLLDPLFRALELGTVPSEEIGAIVNSIASFSWDNACSVWQEEQRTAILRQIWDAIGKCDIYGHRDLSKGVVKEWIGALFAKGMMCHFDLAKDILATVDLGQEATGSWLLKLLTQWLRDEGSEKTQVVEFLRPFDADLISNTLMRLTEDLCAGRSSMRQRKCLFRKLGSCLPSLHDASAISSSSTWTHMRVRYDGLSYDKPDSARKKIIQRLWILYMINKSSADFLIPDSKTNPTIKKLFRMYESARGDSDGDDLWNRLTHDIYTMKIPFDLPAVVNDLRTGPSTSTNPKALQRYNGNPLNFDGIFSNVHFLNASNSHFFQGIDRVIRKIDVSTPAFRDYVLQTARTSDTYTVWTLLRLFRSHTPLKIALSRAWPDLEPSNQTLARYNKPRGPDEPDPHAALDMIHALAIAFACAEQIPPRRAFHLTRWLYIFLLRHGAPIQSPIVRAMYHAGVVRFQVRKSPVALEQYRYCWRLVRQVEG